MPQRLRKLSARMRFADGDEKSFKFCFHRDCSDEPFLCLLVENVCHVGGWPPLDVAGSVVPGMENLEFPLVTKATGVLQPE